MYESLNWLAPKSRRHYHWLQFVLKCWFLNYPPYLKQFLIPFRSSYNLRHNEQLFFCVPKISKEVGWCAFNSKLHLIGITCPAQSGLLLLSTFLRHPYLTILNNSQTDVMLSLHVSSSCSLSLCTAVSAGVSAHSFSHNVLRSALGLWLSCFTCHKLLISYYSLKNNQITLLLSSKTPALDKADARPPYPTPPPPH